VTLFREPVNHATRTVARTVDYPGYRDRSTVGLTAIVPGRWSRAIIGVGGARTRVVALLAVALRFSLVLLRGHSSAESRLADGRLQLSFRSPQPSWARTSVAFLISFAMLAMFLSFLALLHAETFLHYSATRKTGGPLSSPRPALIIVHGSDRRPFDRTGIGPRPLMNGRPGDRRGPSAVRGFSDPPSTAANLLLLPGIHA